jgi:predicted phage-related endonuclease
MGSTPSMLSASRGAGVLGMSEWSTGVSTWLKIMEEQEEGFCKSNGFKKPEFVDNAATRWGNAFENAIAEVFESYSGQPVTSREAFFDHPWYPFLTCHVDGILKYPGGVKIGYEAKTTNEMTYRQKWGEPGTDKIPRTYQVQVQHQMLVTGFKETVVVVLVFPRMPQQWEELGLDPDADRCERWAHVLADMGYFHEYHVKANYELQKTMLEEYVNWWQTYVIGRKRPPAKAYSDIRKLVPEPVGSVIATPEIERWSREYKDYTKEIAEGNKRKAQLKTLMLDYIDENCEKTPEKESKDKWLIFNQKGKKIHSYDGKTFR